MFVHLKALLAQCQSLRILMSSEGDQFTVVVVPESKEKGVVALAMPFSLTGTAEEIDAVFLEKLEEFTTARKGLVDQNETTKTILEAARVESAAKAVKGPSKPAGTNASKQKSDSAPSLGNENDGEDDNDDSPNGSDAGSEASAPVSSEPAAPATANLFE